MDRSGDPVVVPCPRRRRSQPCRKPRNGLDSLCHGLFSSLLDSKLRTPKRNGKFPSRKDPDPAQQPVKRAVRNLPRKEREKNTTGRDPDERNKPNPSSLVNENGDPKRRRRVSPASRSASVLDLGPHSSSPSVLPKKLRIKIVNAARTICIEDAGPRQGERMTPYPKKCSSDLPHLPTHRSILRENNDDEGLSSIMVKGLQTDSLTMLVNEETTCRAPVLKPCDCKDKNGQTSSLQGMRKNSRVPKRRVMDGDEEEEIVRKHCHMGISEESAEGLYQYEESGEVAQKEALLTARQRSLQSTKEGMPSLIEFSQGLPPVTRKQKNTFTEAEKQIKKEEAAQRRRVQIEKTARELQDQAIHKILSQDSTRKKREMKQQKQREEKEEEKNATAMNPLKNSMHIHVGPSGTVLSFSKDMDLSIFSGPCSYPKEREKCASPACNNAYKYRDSKSKLPLCSLECYKAVRSLAGTSPAC